MQDKPRNLVHKNSVEFNKPKVFRDRKKHPSKAQQRKEKAERIGEAEHPKHAPYEREDKAKLLNTLLGDWDAE